ncbi:hypothetical protein QFC19_000669 [Naganishia cerealis]|uniref:Uncharacterized protein n=1 Tax=Naganishia cerealis TaxID=610337 RepID=A0ACC2WNC0_9TREE|nr:hypothetical protein QFC19_000669 [Naganishia cerealis]
MQNWDAAEVECNQGLERLELHESQPGGNDDEENKSEKNRFKLPDTSFGGNPGGGSSLEETKSPSHWEVEELSHKLSPDSLGTSNAASALDASIQESTLPLW